MGVQGNEGDKLDFRVWPDENGLLGRYGQKSGLGHEPTSAVLDICSEVGIGTQTNISSVRYVVRSQDQDTNQHQQC